MQSFPAGFLAAHMRASAAAAARLAEDAVAAGTLHRMAETLVACFRAGGRLLLAGNGGSAADAAHIAAEFLSRCHFDRPPLPAMALSALDPAITACLNDYGPETIFARQITALGRAGDVLLVLTTSGNSPNILRAAEAARERGMTVLGFTGETGGKMAGTDALLFRAPEAHGQIVQQLHMQAAHALIGLVEHALFGAPP